MIKVTFEKDYSKDFNIQKKKTMNIYLFFYKYNS